MNIQIMIDGGGDLPASLKEKYQVITVPLNIQFGNKQYKPGVDLDLPEFFKKLKESDELPKTSAPGPHFFYEAYKQIPRDKPILMLSLSKGLSATYQNASIGKNMLLEEDPDRQIEVLNTKTATSGIALLVKEAGEKITEGLSFSELVDHMEERIEKTTTLFILKNLENLVKGGRLDRVKGAIAKTLNIKLLMNASEEGTIEVSEKVRGDKKSIRRFIEQIGEYAKDFENKTISLSHCNAPERAESILAKIKERYPFKDSILAEMGPLIATYAAEGGIVIAFFRD
ncbi:MAG: DegV family protein [Bacillaceae bacterium]|nr:DegV family protein [Bacillaceae bacterium]